MNTLKGIGNPKGIMVNSFASSVYCKNLIKGCADKETDDNHSKHEEGTTVMMIDRFSYFSNMINNCHVVVS